MDCALTAAASACCPACCPFFLLQSHSPPSLSPSPPPPLPPPLAPAPFLRRSQAAASFCGSWRRASRCTSSRAAPTFRTSTASSATSARCTPTARTRPTRAPTSCSRTRPSIASTAMCPAVRMARVDSSRRVVRVARSLPHYWAGWGTRARTYTPASDPLLRRAAVPVVGRDREEHVGRRDSAQAQRGL